MRIRQVIFAALLVSGLFLGCQESQRPAGEALSTSHAYFTVNFTEGKPLSYQVVSQRNIVLDLAGGEETQKKKGQKQTMSEKVDFTITYRPVEVDPYGASLVEATIDKINIQRQGFARSSGRDSDAANHFADKSFRFTVTPDGKIVDQEAFDTLVTEVGDKTFSVGSKTQGRIKNPDMIWDVVIAHMNLWNVAATIPKPSKGMAVGKDWTAPELVPLPMPIPIVKDTTFMLEEIRETDQGHQAIVETEFALSEKQARDMKNLPKPYSGNFRVRGMFGFLRNYRFQSLTGSGQQVFNLKRGVLESAKENYNIDIRASFLMPLGDSEPILNIDQSVEVQLIEN